MRLRLAAGTALAVTVGVTFAAPGLKDRPEEPYFATRVGARWVTEIQGREYTYVVTQVTREDGAMIVSVGRVEGRRIVPQRRVKVSDKGLVLTEDWHGRLLTPYPLLRTPVKVGTTWSDGLDEGRGRYLKGKRRVAGVEKVEVPAGTFRAVRVEWDCAPDNDPPYRVTIWYAPGIGEIKTAIDGKVWSTLRSFSPGTD
jgi:hypothetical protein